MDNELLDSISVEKLKPNIKEFIVPILILTIFIYTIYYVIYDSLSLDDEDYIAFILIGLSTASSLINKKLYIYSLILILLFGAFSFYSLTPEHTTYSFYIGPANWLILRLSPIPLFLLTIHLFIFRKISERNKKDEEENEKIQINNETNKYKTKFYAKTDEELEQIINGKGFRNEAVQASKELLIERHKPTEK
jgi:sensor histidine kinase YesM